RVDGNQHITVRRVDVVAPPNEVGTQCGCRQRGDVSVGPIGAQLRDGEDRDAAVGRGRFERSHIDWDPVDGGNGTNGQASGKNVQHSGPGGWRQRWTAAEVHRDGCLVRLYELARPDGEESRAI